MSKSPRKSQIENRKSPQVFCAHDKLVPIADLQPHPRNPNKHPAEQLRLFGKIIRTNGWRRPIVVSNLSGCIIKGHGAWLAAQREGFAVAPVNFQIYPSAEAELQDLLADNELARLAENDTAEMERILAELSAAGADPELAGILAQLEGEPKLTALDTATPPKMGWVLIGLPLTKFGALDSHLQAIAAIPDALIESTVTN